MIEHCTAETGLLKKKPCGNPAVAKCANCERPLCSHHALPQLNEQHHKTGAFLCKECDVAARDYDKRMRYAKEKEVAKSIAAGPKPAAKPATMAKEPPREHSGEIAFTAGTTAPSQKPPPPRPATIKPAAVAPAPKKPEPPREDSGMIEYTPAKKPDDKK
jgi:hypothetical protein